MRKANKIFARSMAAVLSLAALLGATACGGGGGNGGGDEDNNPYTTIKIQHFGGMGADNWLKEAFDRFAAKYEGVELQPGKIGVKMDLEHSTGIKINNLHAKTAHIVFAHNNYSDYFAEMAQGNAYDLTSLMTTPLTEYNETATIESKIREDYRFALKGNDGKYYMLPHDESISGASYDADLFGRLGFYLAVAPAAGVDDPDVLPYTCTITGQTVYFTSNSAKKTVGNDGKAGTEDDGMPTTLNELVAQCAYIASKDVAPFSCANNHIDYSNHLVEALWAALAGYEQRNAVVTSAGTVDYVTGEGDTELWAGTGIKVPVTTSVTLNAADNGRYGYQAINQASRYYAFAFMKLAYDQGWITSYQNNGNTHEIAMQAFMLNGIDGRPQIASHLEGSYWYNESRAFGHMTAFKNNNTWGQTVKNVKHWNMPTSVGDDVVTSEANARKEALTNFMTSGFMINKKAVSSNKVVEDLVVEFVRFICSEAELQNFTKCSGIAKALYNYTIDESVTGNLDPYHVSTMAMRGNSTQYPIVNQYGSTDVYRYMSSNVTYSANASGYKPEIGPKTYSAVLDAYWQGGASAWDAFYYTGFEESDWVENVYNKALENVA